MEIANAGGTYGEFVYNMHQIGCQETPDGVKWDDVNVDGIEINEMMEELIDD